MNWLEYVCIVSLTTGLWKCVYDKLHAQIPGYSYYQNKIYVSYRLSTVNAIVTTLFGGLWWLGAPYMDIIASASLVGYFSVDLQGLMRFNYWPKHKDQCFHHFLSMVCISVSMLLGGPYLRYCCNYALFSEISTIFCNIRWFMLKKIYKTDPVVFSINKTLFILSFILIRFLYGGVNTYNIIQDTEVYPPVKILGVLFWLLNVAWSFNIYMLMPIVIQMTALSFIVSVVGMTIDSPLSNKLSKMELLITFVSALYWYKPTRGWRRDLDIIVTVGVFGIHTAVCLWLQQWWTIPAFMACLMSWYLGHVYNSNAVHLGVHFLGCFGIIHMHYDNIQNLR